MFSGVTHETSVLCSKLCSNYVGLKWHFHPTPHRLLPLSKYSQSFSFENKLGSLAKCTGYTNLRYQLPKIFPLSSTLYIPERVAGKICIHFSRFSETRTLCCKNSSVMPAQCSKLCRHNPTDPILVSLWLLIKKGGFGPVRTPHFSWAEHYSLN